MRTRRAAIGACLIVIAAATPTAAGDDAVRLPKPAPKTFETELIKRTRPDGTVPVKVALAAFEAAFGPLDGVRVRPLPGKGMSDGTLAAELVLFDVWDELTPSQQEAVLDVLTPRDLREVPTSAAPAVGRALPRGTDDLGVTLDRVRDEIASRLGRSLTIPIRYGFGDPGDDEGTARATATPASADGTPLTADETSPVASCTIMVRPGATGTGDSARDLSIFAHEVFHCFQFDLHTGAEIIAVPDWVREGQAA
ncbi:MAG: hypothetical protein FJW86_00895 [Actinobacteria bacterium]|nr:hypothetical protein [Actinomycetota bacterium]